MCMSTLKCMHKHSVTKQNHHELSLHELVLFTVCKSSLSFQFYRYDWSHSCTYTHIRPFKNTCTQSTQPVIFFEKRVGDAGQSAMEVKMLIVYTKWCLNKQRSKIRIVMKVVIVRWRILDMTVEMNHTTAFKVAVDIFSVIFRGQTILTELYWILNIWILERLDSRVYGRFKGRALSFTVMKESLLHFTSVEERKEGRNKGRNKARKDGTMNERTDEWNNR